MARPPESVRSAFLTLTKQFHPARFGRMSNELQRLSNEVFLGIKAAHELLLKSLGVTTRGGSTMQTGGMPVLTAEGTNRTQQRPGTPPVRARPAHRRHADSGRQSTGSGDPAHADPDQARPRARFPVAQQRRSGPERSPADRGTSAGTPQLGRRTPPERRSTQRIRARVKAAITPQAVAPSAIRRPSIRRRRARHRRMAAAAEDDAGVRRARRAPASPGCARPEELGRGGRRCSTALAARVPASKQYRALLAHTRGREAQTRRPRRG